MFTENDLRFILYALSSCNLPELCGDCRFSNGNSNFCQMEKVKEKVNAYLKFYELERGE